MVNTAYIPVSCPETPHSSLPIAQTYQIFKGNHKSHLFQSYQLLYEAIISYLILNLMLLTIQTFPQFNIPFVFRHLMINFFIITMKFPNATHKRRIFTILSTNFVFNALSAIFLCCEQTLALTEANIITITKINISKIIFLPHFLFGRPPFYQTASQSPPYYNENTSLHDILKCKYIHLVLDHLSPPNVFSYHQYYS